MLDQKLKNKKILLASKSPRRRELLASLGIDFEIVIIKSDEAYPSELKREKITEYIAVEKSDVYGKLNPDEILITADTIVWFNDQKIGKPKDKNDAFEMLSELSGNTHEVFTSVCVRTDSKKICFSETTEVDFDFASDEEILYYIENFNPLDKAGSYGIQDWFGFTKVLGIRGDYYNVMGLPVRKLYQVLNLEF
ncbi:MAG: septum formation protein Maf [Flavobacteriia bacterium]|nr:septum formation protein Maf [Flavobacteriia bacterium]